MAEDKGKMRKPGRPKKKDALRHRRQGDDLAGRGRFPEAERAYREALRIAPGDAGALEGLALVLERLGREQEALEYRERQELLERWPLWDDSIRRSLEGPD